MARIAGEIIIGRPVDVVFGYVADQSNEPRYNRRTTEMLIECTGYDRPKLFATRTTMRPLGPLITWLGIRQERRIWTSLKRQLESFGA